jgi:amino acid adenylation domain-containing protein
MSKLAKRYGDLSPAEKRALLEEKLQKKASQSVSFHPLSHGQRALWFLYQLAPDSSAYNVIYAARIRSALDIPALRRALQALIDRHATLRTTYGTRRGELVQQVHQQQDVHFEVIDASSWNPARLDAQLFEEADRPFDLEQGQVLRLELFKLSEQEHILLLTIHHIAADFWSLDVLVHELSTLYAAKQAGAAASLPPLQVQYTDYVRWQAELLAGSEGEKLRDFWLSNLAGELPTLNLPTDRVRPPIQSFRGASLQYRFELDEELSSRLRALSKAAGTTLYMTALAAFQVLLHRYSGQDDILVGSPALGRSRAEWEQIVGYLINPLVFRADFSENPTFRTFLDQVRRTVLSALEHQEYPFPLLVEQLQPTRDPSRSPLFQVMFVWDRLRQREGQPDALNLLAAGSDEADIQVEPMISEQRGAALDLTLTMFEVGEALSGAVQYNVDLFDKGTIGRMVEHFQTLLRSIVADPTQRIAHLKILTDAEMHTLHVTWNETAADYPSQACVHELFEAQVKRTPEAVACISGEEPFGVAQDGQLTYGELNRRANRLAHYLRASGVGPEALVGICMEPSLEMVIGLLGILKAGGVYVPLDPAYPQERLALMLQDSGARLLLTQERLLADLPKHEVEVVCLDHDWTQIARSSARNPARKATAENLAYVIYTSGSTGKPKGVQVSHRAVCNLLHAMRDQPGIANQDVLLAVTSLSFDIAALEIFLPLMVGARLVVASREVAADGVRLSEMLAACGATVMQATPATWRLLLEAGWPGNPQLKILCGGEALPHELADQLLGCGSELWNLYGPTETTIWSALYPLSPSHSPAHTVDREQDSRHGPVSIGRPIGNTQFYLLDSHLQPVPVGVPGELYIGGDGLARGYLNHPELTEEKFVYVLPPTARESTASPPNIGEGQVEDSLRLYKTGDLVRYRPDGNLEFLNRIDYQVKVRGYRIELGEIEAAMEQHPAVRQVVVVTRELEHNPGEKLLVGYIVSQAAKPSVSELRRFE